MLFPNQVVSFKQLREEGLPAQEITGMYAHLKLFPTPFKGIYYVPTEDEMRGTFIEKPSRVLLQAITIFLAGGEFYFSCRTAEEALGLNWRPSGSVHIVNGKLSRRIDLSRRVEWNNTKGTWRSRKVAKLLSFYGNKIIFHKAGGIGSAKTKRTPYGRFATRSQIRLDKKRFRER